MPDLGELERRLWDAADDLRANSGLKASEYGTPVLGLIFLRFADARFTAARDAIEAKGPAGRSPSSRREPMRCSPSASRRGAMST